MTPVSRRGFLAATPAGSVAFGMQAARPSDIQDAQSPPRRHMLSKLTSAAKIESALVPRDRWTPYPNASDRKAWASLPAAARAEILAAGEKAIAGTWASLPATLFLGYVRKGNRSEYEAVLRGRRERLRALALAECVEGKGRFLDEIANGVWTTCEETWWGYPAHLSLQKRGNGLPDVNEQTIDLFAAEAGSLLAWVDYLLGPQIETVHKLVRERIGIEIERRILKPYEARSDFWWMGLEAQRPMNNWNPWINSNCLACVLLMERDQARRARLAYKVVTSVDRFLDSYHEDGGCDEGPGYFGHAGGSLFDNLDLLHRASNGGLNFFDVPLVKAIGRYICKVQIADDWYVNFADASARVSLAGDVVYRYGVRIGDRNMQLLGAQAARGGGTQGASLLREIPALFNAEIRTAEGRYPLLRDAWLPGIQVMTARMQEGSAAGLYLAAQGGHNAESHNHNDVGNFVVYADGKPAIIDVGVETYSAKTFSSKRYEIWTMQSAYHNCPTVNGVMQFAGRKAAASDVSYKSDDTGAEFSLDLAAAYPAEAGIESWKRTMRLDRKAREIVIRDAYALRKAGGSVDLTLMTPLAVVKSGAGELMLGTVKVRHPESLTAAIEEVRADDARLKPVWGERVYRVLLKGSGLPQRGEFELRIRA